MTKHVRSKLGKYAAVFIRMYIPSKIKFKAYIFSIQNFLWPHFLDKLVDDASCNELGTVWPQSI